MSGEGCVDPSPLSWPQVVVSDGTGGPETTWSDFLMWMRGQPCPPTSDNDVSAFSCTNKVTRPKSGAVKDKLMTTSTSPMFWGVTNIDIVSISAEATWTHL